MQLHPIFWVALGPIFVSTLFITTALFDHIFVGRLKEYRTWLHNLSKKSTKHTGKPAKSVVSSMIVRWMLQVDQWSQFFALSFLGVGYAIFTVDHYFFNPTYATDQDKYNLVQTFHWIGLLVFGASYTWYTKTTTKKNSGFFKMSDIAMVRIEWVGLTVAVALEGLALGYISSIYGETDYDTARISSTSWGFVFFGSVLYLTYCLSSWVIIGLGFLWPAKRAQHLLDIGQDATQYMVKTP